jgi:hypothetical protein
MARSTDGITWTAVSNSTFGTSNNTIRAIAYGGTTGQEKFVAVGQSGKMARSTDGTTWTAVSSTFGSSAISAIAYGGTAGQEKFVAGGGDGKMATSTDGTTWTAVTQSTFTNYIRAIAYGNGKFVAVGLQGRMAYLLDE